MYLLIYKYDHNDYEILGFVETEKEALEQLSNIKKLLPKNPFKDSSQQMAFEKILDLDWGMIQDEIEQDYWANVAPDDVLSDFNAYNNADKTLKKNIEETRYNWFKENHPGLQNFIKPYFDWIRRPYDENNYQIKKVEKFDFSKFGLI